MSDKKESISDIKLERFLLNELPAKEQTALQTRLAADEPLKGRLDKLKLSNQELLERFPPHIEANIIRNKIHNLNTREEYNNIKEQNFNWKKASLLFSSAAALLLVLVTLIPRQQDMLNEGQQSLNYAIKGLEPKMEIFLNKKPRYIKLEEGKLIREGDILQLKYRAAGIKFGTIISYDGLGNITLHFPDNGADKPLLQQNGFVPLAHAYQLDNAPRYEKFVFITSPKEFSVSQALEHVKTYADTSNHNIKIPENWQQQIITLIKEN